MMGIVAESEAGCASRDKKAIAGISQATNDYIGFCERNGAPHAARALRLMQTRWNRVVVEDDFIIETAHDKEERAKEMLDIVNRIESISNRTLNTD